MDPRDQIATRVCRALSKAEENWNGRTIGIGYEYDLESGEIEITFVPKGAPQHTITITADITGVSVGQGPSN